MRIHYLDYNPSASAVVLLLHGLGATGESWAFQIPDLITANFRVLAPDTRGFGKSSFPGGGMSVEIMANDMAALLIHLKCRSAHVVGISMGGTLALQLANEHTQMVNRLVLVNTFANLRPNKSSLWYYFIARFILVHILGLPAQARAVSRHLFPRPDQEVFRVKFIEQITQADPAAYRGAMRALARFDLSSQLATITHPCLVITGEEDTTVPIHKQRELAANLSHARQVVIPNAGHAVSVEQPIVFNTTLIDFLLDPHLEATD